MSDPSKSPGDDMSFSSAVQLAEKTNDATRDVARSILSHFSVPGDSPFDVTDDRLNPESPHFSAKEWIRNFRRFRDKDTNFYKPYSLGVTYRNLEASGNAAYADYQSDVFTVLLKYFSRLKATVIKPTTEPFQILKPMDASINAGDLVVVLGRPGAGCTTLLKSISAQTYGFHIGPNSEISYDGLTPRDIVKHFRGEIIYNAEAEIHFPHLTVWQTLYFAALMRVPKNRIPGVTRDQWAEHITKVYMAMYGLTHTVKTKVGDNFVRGVSGGERKRVSIAEASICGAPLQCWDNATRGLDAATALEFLRSLRILCDTQDTTVLISIYQCPQEGFRIFDKVSVLYEGRQIYFGPVDKAKQFFVEMGFECPDRQTEPDFLTSLTSPPERVIRPGFEKTVPKTPDEFEQRWKESKEYAALMSEINTKMDAMKHDSDKLTEGIREGRRAMQADHLAASSPYTVSFFMQVKYCTMRSFQRMRGSLVIPLTTIFGQTAMALIIGSVFYNLTFTTSDIYYRTACLFFAVLFNAFSSLLEIFSLYEARPIVLKHRSYALYRPAAEAASSILSEVPVKLASSIAFNVILYFMTGLRGGADHFFFYFLQGITATFVMSHMFRTIGAATKELHEAMTPASIFLSSLAIYAGFAVPTTYMLGWSRWINYLDPISYTFEAMVVNEFWGVEYECSTFVPSGDGYASVLANQKVCSTSGAVAGASTVEGSRYVQIAFNYTFGHMWRNWGIQVSYVIVFLFVYLFIVERNPGYKQKGEKAVFRWKTLRKMVASREAAKNTEVIEAPPTEHGEHAEHLGDKLLKTLHNGGDIFHWRNVNYFVKVGNEERQLLRNVDGWVKPGTLTALMGASGAGKTTLLDVLAERKTVGVVRGSLLVNGQKLDKSFQSSTGYVQQADLHLQTSTVREALRFSAILRQPRTVSYEEKMAYVENVIDILEMRPYADAVVGVEGEGLNVEQRKRLTIGVELAAKPKLLLFLDEPTSGLDSQTAWSICCLIKKLSNAGQAILCTIHQPSAILFNQFDNLLFLRPGGETVYFGPLGDGASTLINYFTRNGAPDCPVAANPAEWMLEVTGAAPGSYTEVEWHKTWRESPEYANIQSELDRMETELPIQKPLQGVDHQSYAAPYHIQFFYVTRRIFQQYWRTPSYIWSKFIISVGCSLLNGFTFFHAKNSLQGLQNQMFSVFMFTIVFTVLAQQMMPQFATQRKLYEVRERPSKTFSWIAFIVGHIIAEIPWQVLCGTLAFFSWYYPIGLYRNAVPSNAVHERGALVYLFVISFYMFTSSLGQMCIAGMEVPDAAANVASILFTLTLLFCGALRTKVSLPRFWIFMYRVSPMTYYIAGVLAAAVADTNISCSNAELVSFDPPDGQTCGQYMDAYITKNNGYLTNSNATAACQYCSSNSTNTFLDSIFAPYSQAWRNFGIFFCYNVFNWLGTVFLYWYARVPHRSIGDVVRDWRAGKKDERASVA